MQMRTLDESALKTWESSAHFYTAANYGEHFHILITYLNILHEILNSKWICVLCILIALPYLCILYICLANLKMLSCICYKNTYRIQKIFFFNPSCLKSAQLFCTYNIPTAKFSNYHKLMRPIKGLAHPKMKIKSLITHPHAVPAP